MRTSLGCSAAAATCRNAGMDWQAHVDREQARVEDGEARMDPEQLVRIGNAAYGAGLSLLMLGRRDEANAWLGRAATRWRESWEHATPTSWGRPIGTIKASLIAGDRRAARAYSRWALELGTETAESPIGRYAATLALLTLARWPDARHHRRDDPRPRRLPARRGRRALVDRRERRRRLRDRGRARS